MIEAAFLCYLGNLPPAKRFECLHNNNTEEQHRLIEIQLRNEFGEKIPYELCVAGRLEVVSEDGRWRKNHEAAADSHLFLIAVHLHHFQRVRKENSK